MAGSVGVKLPDSEDLSPSFSAEFFSIEVLPVATAIGYVTLVLLAGGGRSAPSFSAFVDALQRVKPVSLTVWIGFTVVTSILMRPVSRGLFNVLVKGFGAPFFRWRKTDIVPHLPLPKAKRAVFMATLDLAADGIDAQTMRRLLPEEDREHLDALRYSWESSARMSAFLAVAAFIVGCFTLRTSAAGVVVTLLPAVLAVRYYGWAITGLEREAAAVSRGYRQIGESTP